MQVGGLWLKRFRKQKDSARHIRRNGSVAESGGEPLPTPAQRTSLEVHATKFFRRLYANSQENHSGWESFYRIVNA